MKKSAIVLALLLVFAVAFQAAAFNDEFQGTGRGSRYNNWKNVWLSKTLNVNIGAWRAMSATVVQGGEKDIEDPDWLGSIGAKLWFYRSNWGVGVDAVLLNTQEIGAYDWVSGTGWVENTSYGTFTISQWLVDVDIFYRMPLTPKLQLIAGAGLTYFIFDAGGAPQYESTTAEAGYNVKLGGELMLSDSLTVSGMFTWHQFKTGSYFADAAYLSDTSVEGEEFSKMFSFAVSLNWYI